MNLMKFSSSMNYTDAGIEANNEMEIKSRKICVIEASLLNVTMQLSDLVPKFYQCVKKKFENP